MKDKKKEEQEQRLIAETVAQPKEEEKKKGKDSKAADSKEIRFGKGAPSFYSMEAQFPKEGKKATGSAKKEDKKPVAAAPEPEAGAQVQEPPRFINSKKPDDKPVFAKLEEATNEFTHEGELVSSPYKEREFKIAGETEKPYHKPKKDWYKDKEEGREGREVKEGTEGKEGKEDKKEKEEKKEDRKEQPRFKKEGDFHREGPKKEHRGGPRKEGYKKEEGHKKREKVAVVPAKIVEKKKAGDKVATFTVSAPTAVI